MSDVDASKLSESMRPVRKFIVQAKQLDGVNPQVAYLCRLYAVQAGMKLKSTGDDMDFILSLMDALEANQLVIAQYPTPADRHNLVDEFAADLFEKADNQDRSPQGSTDDTCRAFLAIAILVDVEEHFGELSEASVAIRRYATWKAADIRRALKSGQRPMVGGPEGIDPFYDPDAAASQATPAPAVTQYQQPSQASPSQQYQQPSQPSHSQQYQQPPQPSPTPVFQQPAYQQPTGQFPVPNLPPQSQHPSVPLTATTIGDSVTIKGNLLPREQALAQVDRLCKHAISAIAFEDTKTAMDKLTQALSLLIPHRDQ